MRKIINRFSFMAFFLAMLLVTGGPAEAQTPAPNAMTPNAAANPDQAQQTPAGKFVQDLGNQAISVMADKSLSPDQHTQKYRDLLQNAFDMQAIAHFVLGRAWNSATQAQQQEFTKLFEQSVLNIYGQRLNLYSGESFRVTGARQESDKDFVVNSEVTHSDGSTPTTIDWRVRTQNGKPAIVDVTIAGVSQSVTQRDEYAAILQRNNGNIDALLDMMRQRAQQQNQQQGAISTQ